jgi:hypothetical protein
MEIHIACLLSCVLQLLEYFFMLTLLSSTRVPKKHRLTNRRCAKVHHTTHFLSITQHTTIVMPSTRAQINRRI